MTHVLGSAMFLLMAFIASPDWPNISEMLSHPFGLEDFVFQLEVLLFFYLNYYFLIDRYYFSKKYITYAVVLLVLFVLFVPFTGYLIHHFYPHHLPPKFHPPHKKVMFLSFLINRKFYLFLLTLAFSLFLKIWQRLKRIESEHISAELNLLKAQINPHFLFNTLNSIYSLSLQRSTTTSEALIKLSSMMRYVLKDSEQKFVNLKEEVNYLNDYIELQKLRLTENVKLNFEVSGDFASAKIAPMVLIPFIENAFKYGINTEDTSKITIRIDYLDPELRLLVQNTKVKTVFNRHNSTGLGLVNVRKRLNLMYTRKYKLNIDNKREEFNISLVLQLND